MLKKMLAVTLSAVVAATVSGCVTVSKNDDAVEAVADTYATDLDAVANESDASTDNSSDYTASVRAQDDFYGYVNKDTILSYELNYQDSGAGVDYDVQNMVDVELYELIRAIAASDAVYERGSSEWLVREVYNQILTFLDTKESAAADDFVKCVEEIKDINSVEEALDVAGNLREHYGVLSFYDFDVWGDIKDSDSYALYIHQKRSFANYDMKKIYEDDSARKSIKAYAMDVLVMSGEAPEDASKKAENLVYYLVDVACETDFSIDDEANIYETYEFKTNDEIDVLLESISIKDIENGFNIRNPYGGWYIQDEAQLNVITDVFSEENLEVIKTCLLCEYVDMYTPFLVEAYPVLNIYNTEIFKEREMLACDYTVRILDNQIDELYAAYYYTEEMDAELNRMYEDIVSAYETLISDADWLSDAAKEGLLAKLLNMQFVCGGGERWLMPEDNISLLGDDFYRTFVNSRAFNIKVNERNIGTTVDKSKSVMSSYIVNAAYSSSNTFTITVAIMHAPYFDINADYEENLGGIGMIIGHEMGHAFDSNCINFDENGNYNPEWLPESDRQALAERLALMEDYYSSYTIMDVYHIDGELTSSENYADIGAMECLMKIVTDREGRRKLFENYARIWCQYVEDRVVVDLLSNDVHCPSEARVNAVLSSTDGFYDVYEVKPGDGMYVAPEDRVSRW